MTSVSDHATASASASFSASGDRLSQDERQPLLYQPPRPSCCERCLFGVSSQSLWNILVVLFIVHLQAIGHLDAWVDSFFVTLCADVLYALLLLFSLLLCLVMTLLISTDSVSDFVRGAVVHLCPIILTAMLAWYAMLRISELHKLEVRCWACPDGGDASMHLEGLADFACCWRWLPVGLARCLAGVLWRPWWFVCWVIPQALVGHGPLSHGALHWWQCREIIIGVVLQLQGYMLISVGPSIQRDSRWRLLVVLVVLTVMFVGAVPFYLTSDPFVTFWCFLERPWQEFIIKGYSRAEIRLEEWCAMFIMLWLLGHYVYVAASIRIEEMNARKRMEEGLRYALEHPFRAELEQGFGRWDFDQDGQTFVRRKLSRLGSGAVSQQEGGGTIIEKRSQLIERVRESRGNAAVVAASLSVHVRREHLLDDTWTAMSTKPVSELLAPHMVVHYTDEPGSDGGGLTRDWFDSVAWALTEGADDVAGSSLLALGQDQTLVPRQVWRDVGDVPQEEEDKFRALMALGRFVALAVYRGQPLPLSFSLVACKHLLAVPVGMADVQRLDPAFFRGRVLSVLKEGGLQEIEAALGESLVFTSAPTELRPEPEELKANGASISVTDANKTEYVQLLCEAYICGGIRREIQCFLQGFWDVVPLPFLQRCRISPRELSLLISGVRTLDPADWRRHSKQPYMSVSSAVAQVYDWFWEVVGELDEEQRCMMLHFATGSSRLPPTGFADLRPMFNVTVTPEGPEERLPVAHTCSNQIVLPEYKSKEMLREKLLLALSTDRFELF